MYSNFDWPVPAAYEFVPGDDFAGPEPALIVLARGSKIQGSLTRFLATHGIVEFLPSRGRTNIDVPFADIIQLRLTRAILIRRREGQFAEAADGARKQSFRVELANGEVLEGETYGFEVHSAGLFLYQANYGDTVIRTFLPATAIRGQQIGKPLGELLVESRVITETQVRSGLDRQHELRAQRLGDILAEHEVITREDLRQALERQRTMPVIRLGDALIESKRISPEQLDEALALQKDQRKKQLGEILIDLGYLTRPDLYRALSQKLGIPAVDLRKLPADPQALKTVPEAVVREYGVLPMCFDGNALVIAMSNPLDPAPLEKIRFLTQRAQLRPVLAAPDDIQWAIREHFGRTSGEQRIEELAEKLFAEGGEAAADEAPIKETDSTLVKLVNKIVMDAVNAGASDVHIESNAGKRNVGIRFRRDGILTEYLQVPYNFRAAIVSRIKVMAGLDISERRRAQDGRINFRQFGPMNVELRVACVPTAEGLEDVVLRLLNAGEPIPLARLGLLEANLAPMQALLGRSFGLVLVCGPTGSGKTTTLHSLLGVINSPERKIWTAEDPVEISQVGLRQVQMHPKIGWTFAAALRAFLRADPDVVMVGEMRDAETASIAIEASLTGHLVLSTLHTNSASETVVRLLEMGMDPFSFADSLAGILAQRLARRLCDECKTSRPMAETEARQFVAEYCYGTALSADTVLAALRQRYGETLHAYSAKGCDTCRGTGYRGRVGLHELLVVEPDLRQLIQRRAPASELRAAALAAGMRTLRQDGLEKCLLGITDVAEVRGAT